MRSSISCFLGSKPFDLAMLKCLVAAEPFLRWTVIHPDDTAEPESNYDACQLFCRETGTSLKLFKNPMVSKAALAGLSYDIAFFHGWYWPLESHIVGNKASPVYAILHIHLPRYRGGAPTAWSILNDEEKVGGTLFRLSPGRDDGDIALQVMADRFVD